MASVSPPPAAPLPPPQAPTPAGAAALVPPSPSQPPGADDRKATIELYGKALDGFDRTIVAVASGALALSVTFLHDIAPNPTAASKLPLLIGWGCLMGSLLAMITSMLSGHKALESNLREDEKWSGIWTTATTGLNLLAAGLLIGGFVGLATFASQNTFARENGNKDAKAAACSPELANADNEIKKLKAVRKVLEDPKP